MSNLSIFNPRELKTFRNPFGQKYQSKVTRTSAFVELGQPEHKDFFNLRVGCVAGNEILQRSYVHFHYVSLLLDSRRRSAMLETGGAGDRWELWRRRSLIGFFFFFLGPRFSEAHIKSESRQNLWFNLNSMKTDPWILQLELCLTALVPKWCSDSLQHLPPPAPLLHTCRNYHQWNRESTN